MTPPTVIRVTPDVYEDLKKLAQPFEDTPNSVIRRLLQAHAHSDAPKTRDRGDTRVVRTRSGRVRAPRTSGQVFRQLILEALVEAGGRGTVGEIVDHRVYQKVKDRLTDFDLAVLDGGEARWRNAARWARKNMVDEGLMSGGRGQWELTQKGREEVRRRTRKSE